MDRDVFYNLLRQQTVEADTIIAGSAVEKSILKHLERCHYMGRVPERIRINPAWHMALSAYCFSSVSKVHKLKWWERALQRCGFGIERSHWEDVQQPVRGGSVDVWETDFGPIPIEPDAKLSYFMLDYFEEGENDGVG